MEKFFHPNKWFVAFCALLVIVYGVLQWVMNMRIADEAKLAGQRIFSWSWDVKHWSSTAEITKADVVRRSGTDAIVKVRGRQVLTEPTSEGGNQQAGSRSETVDCSATLTFYRASNNWVLGKVELE
jgi:hypothetical protein